MVRCFRQSHFVLVALCRNDDFGDDLSIKYVLGRSNLRKRHEMREGALERLHTRRLAGAYTHARALVLVATDVGDSRVGVFLFARVDDFLSNTFRKGWSCWSGAFCAC